MIHNFTTDHQVNHRSIRQFKDQSLTAEQLTTLYEAPVTLHQACFFSNSASYT